MISLGLLRPPFELGVDVLTGEAQSFGIPLSYGGPYLGIFQTKKNTLRDVPGRIIGETVDRMVKDVLLWHLEQESRILEEKKQNQTYAQTTH